MKPYQQSNGRETDIKLLLLKTKFRCYLDYHLQVGRSNNGQEVSYHQLQTLECLLDQLLSGSKSNESFIDVNIILGLWGGGSLKVYRHEHHTFILEDKVYRHEHHT